MLRFTATPVPEDLLAASLPLRRDFADCYRARGLAPDRLPRVDRLAQAFFSDAMPMWVSRLMALRDRLVARFGLRTGAEFVVSSVPEEIRVGDRVGPWPVVARNEHEIVFRDDDSHLEFAFSLRIDPSAGRVDATTFVKFHNATGRIYFFFVKPFHRLIVPRHMEKVLAAAMVDRAD